MDLVKGLSVIGSGTFTCAYECEEHGPDHTVIIETIDLIKLHMANGNLPNHYIFPQIFHYAHTETQDYYTMQYYHTLDTTEHYNLLNPHDMALFKALLNLNPVNDGLDNMIDAVATLNDKFNIERNIIIEAIKSFKVYGYDSVALDPCEFNLAVDDYGRLVLLDIFYPLTDNLIKTGDYYVESDEDC